MAPKRSEHKPRVITCTRHEAGFKVRTCIYRINKGCKAICQCFGYSKNPLDAMAKERQCEGAKERY